MAPKSLWQKAVQITNNPQDPNYSKDARKSYIVIAGFTIIEVLIVLAIAGLILLIVFLAVPALQRNSRNTGRKEDAGRLGGAINNFVSNNNGSQPATTAAGGASTGNSCGIVLLDASVSTLNQFNGLLCLGATTTGNIATPAVNTLTLNVNAAGATVAAAPAGNAVVMAEQGTCPSSGFTPLGSGTTRQMALLYTVELGNTWTWNCLSVQ